METITIIKSAILIYFLIMLLAFWGMIIFKLKEQNIKLKIKNKKLKNIIDIYYGKYGFIKNGYI